MKEPWQKLRVGDRIRIVKLPTTNGVNSTLHSETKTLYRRLIKRKRPLVIYEIDKRDGLPWIKCQFRRKSGGWEYHFLAMNDNSWVLVRPRKKNLPSS